MERTFFLGRRRWSVLGFRRVVKHGKRPPRGGLWRAVALIAHITATQRLWLERALSVPQSVAVWPQWSLPETAKESPAVLGEWTRLVATGDLSREST